MRRHQVQQHVVWMIRSFAMITTALTFRIEHIVFQEIGLAAETGFLVSLYQSIIDRMVIKPSSVVAATGTFNSKTGELLLKNDQSGEFVVAAEHPLLKKKSST